MRKEKTVVLDDRGNKLTFKIREMSATDMSFWALRAFKALGAAGVELPDGADIRTTLKLISANFQTMCKNIDLADVRGLLDDLLRMCSRVVGKAEEPVTPETVDDYIQDVRTLWALYAEAFKVCTDFFGDGKRSKSQNSPTIQLHDAQA